jgi:hypothetical protein
MRNHTRTAAPALLLALAACSAGPPPAAGPRAAAESRTCRAERAALPAAASLVDVEALGADAARLWTESGERPGYVLLTLRYDRDGTNVRRDVLEHTVSDAVADSLQRLVFAHRRRAEPARGAWGARLRVELGHNPALEVAPREVCTPAPHRRGERLALAEGIREPGFADAGPFAPEMVWVRVRLDAQGVVTDARVERGGVAGAPEARLLTYVRGLPFLPALEDGRPVPGETTIPVRLGR